MTVIVLNIGIKKMKEISKTSNAYSEPIQTFKMECFNKIVNG